MNEPLFLKHRMERLLKCKGKEYLFISKGEDEFHQPIDNSEFSIVGVYHEQNSFIRVSNTDAASVQRKKSPMILTLFENLGCLKQGDTVTINSIEYAVAGILDIQNYGIAADISLEMRV